MPLTAPSRVEGDIVRCRQFKLCFHPNVLESSSVMRVVETLLAASLPIVLFVGAAAAQPTIAERSEIPTGPRTKLEALSSTEGAVLTKQSAELEP